MRWCRLLKRPLRRPGPELRRAAELAELDATRRLAEAEQLRAEAAAEAATHREIRRRNHFGPMILGEIGRHK